MCVCERESLRKRNSQGTHSQTYKCVAAGCVGGGGGEGLRKAIETGEAGGWMPMGWVLGGQ